MKSRNFVLSGILAGLLAVLAAGCGNPNSNADGGTSLQTGTLSIASNAEKDGYIAEVLGNGAAMSSTATYLRFGDTSINTVFYNAVSFDLSELPEDASIASAVQNDLDNSRDTCEFCVYSGTDNDSTFSYAYVYTGDYSGYEPYLELTYTYSEE